MRIEQELGAVGLGKKEGLHLGQLSLQLFVITFLKVFMVAVAVLLTFTPVEVFGTHIDSNAHTFEYGVSLAFWKMRAST